MSEDRSPFVDSHRSELIQRVTLVMPLADQLLQQGMLRNEAYEAIGAEKIPQDQMRALYRSLNSGGNAVKTAFYHILRRENPFLVQELEAGQMEVDRVLAAARQLRDFPILLSLGEDRGSSVAPGRPKSHGRKAGGSSLDKEDMYNTRDAVARVKDKKTEIRWHKKSRTWQEKLQLLLKDPDLQSIGKGKLFMVKKREYKIGDGADGTAVYLGMKADGTEVAIKRMIRDHNKELQNEMSLLRDLEDSHIVRYVDLIEDGEFNYLVLQLCEYDLEVYMTELRQKGEDERKKVARDVLLGLEVLHKARVIHRDIKPRNVLIDERGNARLADFGISRRLDRGASTRHTSRAGTEGWEATEILADGNWDEGKCRYKRSADIQVAGMLVHYILSDGHHPFGEYPSVLINILSGKYSLQIQDVEAKDLIEWMITKDPEKRPTIQEVIQHPYFWDDKRRDEFLKTVGNEKAVQKFKTPDVQLCSAVGKFTQGTSFTGWKDKICLQMPEDCRLKIDPKLPDDLLGLMRYLRNFLEHNKEVFKQHKNNMFKDVFPDFFICAYKLAREMGWDT